MSHRKIIPQKIHSGRYQVLSTAFVSLGTVAALLGCQSEERDKDAERPNVIFIITDDQHREEFNFLPEGQDKNGEGVNLTPNIDELVNQGVHFSNMYCSSTVSTPSRYNCLTGQYASRSLTPKERNDNQVSVTWNTKVTDTTTTFPGILQKNGYYTGVVGKIHGIETGNQKSVSMDADPRNPEVISTLEQNQKTAIQHLQKAGFDFAQNIYAGNPYGLEAPKELRVHNLDWIFKGALDFIEKAGQKEEPFFLWLSTTVSHSPHNAESSYNANPLATPVGYLEDTLNIMPPRHTIPERIRESDIPQDRFTDKCNLLWLDDGIGALRSKLKSLGMDENTVIIYFNDHGNENGGKGSLYQSGIRTIGFAWSTNHFRRENAFTPRVQNIDFAPTILDLADVPEKKWQFMDGKSILPAIQGKTNRVHRSLYFEIGNARAVIMDSLKYYAVRHPSRIKNMPYKKRKKLLETKAKRAERRWIDDWPVHDPSKPFDHLGLIPGGNSYSWKTKEHHPHYFDTDQLYNLNRDPEETVNLYNKEAYQKQEIKIKARLNQYVDDLPGDFGEYGDTSFVK